VEAAIKREPWKGEKVNIYIHEIQIFDRSSVLQESTRRKSKAKSEVEMKTKNEVKQPTQLK